MFSQSAEQPAADESPAPVGMRELPPQPARPVMPAFAAATPDSSAEEAGPGPDDSVIARDDHLEGTFTSRGTVVVMGSVKGRIEAVQVRIEAGAKVDADVIVDEAIVAGEFTGNLTCRERLEARASGRINGRVETFRLMLHEGASVEGEMHMLTESPSDASETIRGTAPLRGETRGETGPDTPSAPDPSLSARSAATVTPSSSAKPASSSSDTAASTSPASSPEASAVRSSVAETLKAESMRIAPRATTVTAPSRGYGSQLRTSTSGSAERSGGSTTGL